LDVNATMQDLEKGLNALEHVLIKGKYAAGAKFGYADCALAPALCFIKAAADWYNRSDIFDNHPKIKKYWTAIQKNKLAGPVIEDMFDMIDVMKAGKLPTWSQPD